MPKTKIIKENKGKKETSTSFKITAVGGISSAAGLISKIPAWFTALVIGLSVATYVSFAGIRASILTDKYQFRLILPLVLFSVIMVFVDVDITNAFNNIDDSLISISNFTGAKFGFTLIIAVFAANMFHQGLWQRIYSVKNTKSLIKSFSATAITVIPIVFLFGFIGILSVGSDTANNPSVALFATILRYSSDWTVILFLVLGLIFAKRH